MSGLLISGALVAVGAVAAAPPSLRVCLVAAEAVEGAGVDEVADAVAIEARKHGWHLELVVAADAAGCDSEVTATLGAVTVVSARGAHRTVQMVTLRPIDRAAEVARAVAALAGQGEAGGGELVGALPPSPAVSVRREVVVLPEPPSPGSDEPAPGVRWRPSVSATCAADPGRSAPFGRLDLGADLPLRPRWLSVGAGLDVNTPARTRSGHVALRSVDVGLSGRVSARWPLGTMALQLDLGAGASARRSRATAPGSAAPGSRDATARRWELVGHVAAAIWWTRRLGRGPLWWGIGVLGRRYMGGTDFVAPGGRVEAPRWELGGGLRLGASL